jgi:hypothetical protein
MRSIAEKDWKLLRAMQDEKLDTACEKILAKINNTITNKENENHKAYLKVWKIVKSEDRKIADMFNDLKRSNAVLKLAFWKQNGLLTEQEISQFSPETRSILEGITNY